MSEGVPSMDCKEMFSQLSEFLDGELPAELCEEIRAHMQGCEPCERFMRTLADTVALCRRLPSAPLPDDVRRDLRALLDRLPHRS
jgi:anti-sigma factor (TIGR02949 family)